MLKGGKLAVLAALFIGGLAGTEVSAKAVDLISHRAVYKMRMDSRGSGADMVDAGGLTVYRFSKGCDGWIMENQSSLNMVNDEGDMVRTFWRFNTWESFDGRMYKFHSRHSSDGKLVEEIRGEAKLEGEARSGTATMRTPEQDGIALDAGTLFPTRHLERLVELAGGGQLVFAAPVFDGASMDNPYMVNAVLLADKNPVAPAVAGGAALPARPSWVMRFAYFPRSSKLPEPDFEMEVVYRADGVATQIRQMFPKFSLSGSLVGLELLPDDEC